MPIADRLSLESTGSWLKLGVLLWIYRCSGNASLPTTEIQAVTFTDIVGVHIPWQSTHDPVYIMPQPDGTEPFMARTCEENTWCLGTVMWTFTKHRGVVDLFLKVNSTWSSTVWTFQDQQLQNVTVSLIVCKLDPNEEPETFEPKAWIRPNSTLETVFGWTTKPVAVFLFQSIQTPAIRCDPNSWCMDLIYHTVKTRSKDKAFRILILLNNSRLNMSTTALVCFLESGAFQYRLFSLRFPFDSLNPKEEKSIMSLDHINRGVFHIPISWTTKLHPYMSIFKDSEKTEASACEINTTCTVIGSRWVSYLSNQSHSELPQVSLSITAKNRAHMSRYKLFLYDSSNPADHGAYELIVVKFDMLPQAIKISPEVILGGLAVNFSIPGQFGNHVPQFFFFTNVSTNAYLCKEKTTCGGDFMWTFVGANGTRLMRGLIWTEGKGEFWNSTLISLIGQSVTSYTIKWGKHDPVTATTRNLNWSSQHVTRQFPMSTTQLTPKPDDKTFTTTLIGLAIFAVLSCLAFALLLYCHIKSRKLRQNQPIQDAASSYSLPNDGQRGVLGGYEELASVRLPNEYDALGSRVSDYESLDDFDFTKESVQNSQNLFSNARHVYQSINSCSDLQPSPTQNNLNVDSSSALRRAKSSDFEKKHLCGASLKTVGNVSLRRSVSCSEGRKRISGDNDINGVIVSYLEGDRRDAVKREVHYENCVFSADEVNARSSLFSRTSDVPTVGQIEGAHADEFRQAQDGDSNYLTFLEDDEEPVIYLELKEF
ncbi:hypothetical protein RRG08_009645 [Elysia crispata]|uniref:Uncharacterized protein n=1 Tax=Elysia crispata TaxID=231223 RepID=A0AAE1DNC4_9GAST|nr:hypothetical protein RRG08_009645 [Elysia crispata]